MGKYTIYSILYRDTLVYRRFVLGKARIVPMIFQRPITLHTYAQKEDECRTYRWKTSFSPMPLLVLVVLRIHGRVRNFLHVSEIANLLSYES